MTIANHFQPYTRIYRLIAAVSRRLKFTYTIRNGLAKGMKRRGGLGFVPWIGGDTAETLFLKSLNLTGKVVYDVGAFEGILTMFFSRSATQVISYEPNPQSRSRLETNIRLNGITKVRVRPVALSDARGHNRLVFDPLMPGAATSADLVAGQIKHRSQKFVELDVLVMRLDDDVIESSLAPPDLIKIDVEGLEQSVLRGAERTLTEHRPALYIELHGADDRDKRATARGVVDLLWGWGYRNIFDVENATNVRPETVAQPHHIFCLHPANQVFDPGILGSTN
jgi:FkbM family methyltransferase